MSTFKSSYSNIQVSAETVSRSSSIVAGNIPIFNLSNRMVDSGVLLSTITGGTGTSGVSITGGTYSNGTLVLENSTGGTVSISGFTSFDTFVTGGTYNNTTGILSLINNSGNTFTVSGFSTLNNGVYNYTTWSTDTISGATRQAIANEFNNIINNLNTYTGNTNTTLTNLQNELNGLSSYTQSISSTTQSQVNILQSEITTLSAFTSSYTSSTNTTLTNIQNEITSLSGRTDTFVTGGTYNNNSGILTLENNSGNTFTVGGFALLNNGVYNYSTWSGDTTSGATRQVIANEFNYINNNINSYTSSTNTTLTNIQNELNSLSSYTQSISSTTQNQVNTLQNEINVLSGSVITLSGYTFQNIYNNSLTIPQITTNSVLDGLAIQNGSGSLDNITRLFKGVSSGGTLTSIIRADGYISGTSIYYNNLLSTGFLTYTDSNILAAFQSSVNNYNQIILQNTNTGASASTDYIVSNNLSTSNSYYGDFGMNGSGFTGNTSFNLPNAVYLTSTSTDLLIGTTTNNPIHFAVNGGNDSLIINSNGVSATTQIVSLSHLINGTSGTGYLELLSQSSSPTGITGNLIISANSSAVPGLQLTTQNAANSATINQNLVFPNASTTITFPSPTNGSSDSVAYLNTTQTFSQTNTFSSVQDISSINILNNTGNYTLGLSSQSVGQLNVGASSTWTSIQLGNGWGSVNSSGLILAGGVITLESTTLDRINGVTANGSATSAKLLIVSGGQSGTGNTESVYIDSGLSVSGGTMGGIVLLNTSTNPGWNGLQKGIFIGNALSVPTAAPSTGGYLYSSAGTLNWYSSLNTGGTNSAFATLGNTQTFSGVNTFTSQSIYNVPTVPAIIGQSNTGTNASGGNLIISSGQGTGTGIPSQIIFQVPTTSGLTGTTIQTLVTRAVISNDFNVPGSTTGGALWLGSYTIGSTNYTLANNGTGVVKINGTSAVGTYVNNTQVASYNVSTYLYGNTNNTYFQVSGGSGLTMRYLIDLPNSSTSGLAYGFSINDCFGFTQGNGQVRILGAKIQPVNLTSTAGSEAMSLGIYTQTGGSASTLVTTFSTNGISTTLGLSLGYKTMNVAYTAQTYDYTIDCTGNTFTLTLPSSNINTIGKIYVIKNSGAGTITINTTSSQTIDGASTKVINTQYDGIMVQSDGSNWKIISTF